MEWLGSEEKEKMENGRGTEGKNWGRSPLDSSGVWDELMPLANA